MPYDLGVQDRCIRTGEAFVFLHDTKDPTIAGDESRTAVGQMLAFTLQALAAEALSQGWHDTAHKQLSTWKVEYFDVLRDIPESIRKEPPPSNYRPSYWKPNIKTHNTCSHARCKPDVSTPEISPSESSDGEPSPSSTAAVRRSSRRKGNEYQSGGREQAQPSQRDKQTSSRTKTQRPYCTIACIRGMVNRGPLNKKCPNLQQPGGPRHLMGPREITHKLHCQLVQNRDKGFEPLHIVVEQVDNYRRPRILQGYQIPVCLGHFEPDIAYWYHGELMAHMIILSWSGTRLQKIINNENSEFFDKERDKCLAVLRSHGVVHRDKEWRNMLGLGPSNQHLAAWDRRITKE
ncbi:hypothetical protein BDV12DRAFT_187081 [Aspergillus spectabilis]